VKSTHYFRTDNISLETSVRWLSEDVVSLRSKLKFRKNLPKCNNNFTKKSRLAATFMQVSVTMGTIALPVARLFCMVWAILANLQENLA